MLLHVYEVDDEDVLELFFGGEQPKVMPIQDIAREHGELIFKEDRAVIPDCNDCITIVDAQEHEAEYVVVARTFALEKDLAVLLVHERHVDQPDKENQS